MHEPVHRGLSQGHVQKDYVQRNDQRIGRVGTALGFLALGDQLKQHRGLDLGEQGLGTTDASHQMCPAKCESPFIHIASSGA